MRSFGVLKIIALALVAILGASAWYVGHSHKPPTSALSITAVNASSTAEILRPVLEGYRAYVNKLYHFSLQYPAELAVQEYKESANALTLVFKNATEERSFQIFITPYQETKVTNERFKLDVPTGVMNDATDIIIDSVRGTMFFSTNLAMGDTREVWFIKNGYLYEVTTYKELDAWLASIMATWHFI